MTTDEALASITSAHAILTGVPLEDVDEDEQSAVINAIDELDDVVLAETGVSPKAIAALADGDVEVLLEVLLTVDWSDVPKVSESEGDEMTQRLALAVDALDDP